MIETTDRPRGRPVGTKLSDETKARIGAASKGRPSATARPLSINGVTYKSALAASRAVNLPMGTVRTRCLSDTEQFKDWFFL